MVSHDQESIMKGTGPGLFNSVPQDYLQFGRGSSFDARAVALALGLKNEDVSRLAGVSFRSVRYDDAVPAQVRERLEEIGNTMNLVAQVFDGDVDKAVTWFKTRNSLLGDAAPRDMIRLGRYGRLRRFIISAMMDRRSADRMRIYAEAPAQGH